MSNEAIFLAANVTFFKVAPLIFNVLLALLLLLLGFLIARLLGNLVTYLLKLLQLDAGSSKVGFASFLERGGVDKTLSELIGGLVYWLVVLTVLVSVPALFGLMLEKALLKLLVYMGIIFLAAFILGVGVMLAGLIAAIVRLILANLGVEGARTISRVIYYVVVIFAFLAALAELGISPEVFIPQIGVIIGAFGLAAAIAFGLGCKDMAADFLSNLFKGK